MLQGATKPQVLTSPQIELVQRMSLASLGTWVSSGGGGSGGL